MFPTLKQPFSWESRLPFLCYWFLSALHSCVHVLMSSLPSPKLSMTPRFWYQVVSGFLITFVYVFVAKFAALDLYSHSCDCEWFIGGLHSTTWQCFHTTRFLQPALFVSASPTPRREIPKYKFQRRQLGKVILYIYVLPVSTLFVDTTNLLMYRLKNSFRFRS